MWDKVGTAKWREESIMILLLYSAPCVFHLYICGWLGSVAVVTSHAHAENALLCLNQEYFVNLRYKKRAKCSGNHSCHVCCQMLPSLWTINALQKHTQKAHAAGSCFYHMINLISCRNSSCIVFVKLKSCRFLLTSQLQVILDHLCDTSHLTLSSHGEHTRACGCLGVCAFGKMAL